MDPDELRKQMIEAANIVLHTMDEDLARSEAQRLAECVHDIDEWLRKGGFYPDVWVHTYDKYQPNRKQDV